METDFKLKAARKALRTNVQLYPSGSLWVHKPSGRFYMLLAHGLATGSLTPMICYSRIEKRTVDGVGCWGMAETDSEIWVRPAEEFLDGRFVSPIPS